MNYFTNLQLKTTFKADNTYLIFSLKKKEHINENQLQFLQNKLDHGILNATWTKAGNGNRLVFDISNLVCLSEYIKAEMTQEKYFDFISQFQKIMEFCSNSTMPTYNLLCNLKYSYYSPSTQQVYFAYLPVTDNSYRTNIVKFLYEMHHKANIIISNGNTMNKYQEYLERLLLIQKKSKNNNTVFSHNDLYNFLHDISSSRQNPDIHDKVSDIRRPDNKTDNIKADISQLYTTENYGSMVTSSSDSDSGHHHTGTVAASCYNESTSDSALMATAYITDSKGKKYYIDHTPFNIGRKGKSENIDVSLSNIPEVSGFHASIVLKDGAYFIEDKSRNGTFISKNKADKNIFCSSNRIHSSRLENKTVFYIYHTPFTFYSEDEFTKALISDTSGISKTRFVNPQAGASDYIAYIKDTSSGETIYINALPFEHEQIPGIKINYTANAVDSYDILNVSQDLLSVEGESIQSGSSFTIFSGCTFSIGSKSFTFYIKN